MRSVELYLMHNVQWMMHNYDARAHLLPRKLALPSLGGAGEVPHFGQGVGSYQSLLQMPSQEGLC